MLKVLSTVGNKKQGKNPQGWWLCVYASALAWETPGGAVS